jgi:hypothetical protein
MSYTLNPDGTVTLDSGEKVTVSVTQSLLPNGRVEYSATAKSGKVKTAYNHSADDADPQYAKEALLIVLGEEVKDPKILLSNEARRSLSIRHRLNVSKAPPLDHKSLL